jgi:hypothetical protein
MKRCVGIVAFVSLCTGNIFAAQVRISVSGAIAPGAVNLRAQRVDGRGEPRDAVIDAAGAGSISLGEGLWEIRLDSHRFWAAPIFLRDGDSGSLELFPASEIRGTVNDVRSLRARFSSVKEAGLKGEVQCDVEGGDFRCLIPDGTYDIRFSAPAKAPEFRFALQVPRNAPMQLKFVAGASLSGRLETARHVRAPLEGIEVLLVDDAKHRFSSVANARGFFQFKGLPPGTYALRARKQGLAAESRSVKILAGIAAELNKPLLLDRPHRLTVIVSPPLDPSSVPWRIELSQTDFRPRRTEIVSDSAASANGEWRQDSLIAGEYEVRVRRREGEQWYSGNVTLEDDDVTLPIAVVGTRLRGTISLGEKPIAASLSFGGEGGAVLHADEFGAFDGQIPPGDSERLLLVECDLPRIRRTLRVKPERGESGEDHLDIRLPSTTLLGRVVDEDRKPMPHAIVNVSRDHPVVFEQTFTEADGAFQIAGFEPGTYSVTADDFEMGSKRTPVTLEADKPTEVEIVLQKEVHVPGRMMIESAPVINAEIVAVPRDTWAPTLHSPMTDEQGRFRLALPPGTHVFDCLAVHPAFDVVMGRGTVEAKKLLHIATRQIGGTLRIESASSTDSARPMVRHAGAEFAASHIAGKAGGSVDKNLIVIPRLEPGEYSVCAGEPVECSSGYVPPYGTLTLTLGRQSSSSH